MECVLVPWRGEEGAFTISFVVANLFWLLMVVGVAETSLAIRNVGPEGAALPILFTEMLLLIPLCVVVALGWIALIRSRKAAGNETLDPESSSG